MYKKSVLDNRLSVVTHYMPNRVSVSLGVWVKVGSRYEKKELNGVSHFLEHLLFKGTKKRDCEEIKQAIEGIGGSLNGFTSEELTCYLAKVPGQYFSTALAVLSDMVLNARLDNPDIEMERKVILEEIRMYKDLPSHFVMDILSELLWPAQPLGRNIAGEPEIIESVTQEQLRNYQQKFYQPQSIFVVCCGDVEHEQVVSDAQKCFSLSSDRQADEFQPASCRHNGPHLKVKVKKTEQTHLALGVQGLARNHPDRFALGLLHIILGANMSSRLFREVREKRGLAYAIGTSLKMLQDAGAFIIHAGIDNQRFAQALDVILQQLRQIKQEEVDSAELSRAKEYFIGQLLLGLEDTAEHMLWLGENAICLNKFLYAEEVIRGVGEINAQDLISLANRILQTSDLSLAVIGPLKEKDKLQIKQSLDI